MAEGERCIVDTERGKASYFTEYAPCIHTRIGGSGATVVLVKRNKTDKNRREPLAEHHTTTGGRAEMGALIRRYGKDERSDTGDQPNRQ